ncbi:dirigent protein 4-like [Musa acuminata AAA Group]|uniref:dirigent protein 4-like n=1 Tax=Musa acuminata AAA Group TaxID=214697 RepID=UPI0031DCB62F
MKQQVTNLHFFFHDIAGGDNPTVVHVAAPKNLSSLVKEPSFGTVYAIDDPLTEGPEADSTAVGSAQGFYISSGQDAPMLVFTTDYGFAPSACSQRNR